MGVSNSEMELCIPPDIKTVAGEAIENLLPEKSKGRYEKVYRAYRYLYSFQGTQNINLENVV